MLRTADKALFVTWGGFSGLTRKTPFRRSGAAPRAAARRVPRVCLPRQGSRRKCLPARSMRRPDGGRRRAVSEAMWGDGGVDSQRISAPIECRAGRTPMGLNHAFLFSVWGGLGEWGNDGGEAVSLHPGQTCGEPSPATSDNGSSQPMRRNPQTEKSWLPDEDSNRDQVGAGKEARSDDESRRNALIGLPADRYGSALYLLANARAAELAGALAHRGTQPVLQRAVADPDAVRRRDVPGENLWT